MHLVDAPCADEPAAVLAAAAGRPTRASWPLAGCVSIEATGRQLASIPDLERQLPAGTAVYLPHLKGDDWRATAATAKRVAFAGLRPIPHLTARTVASRTELAETLAVFEDAAVDSVLLIAGDVDRPRGSFTSTLDVLATGLLEAHGMRRVGFAGHPEGHPAVPAASLEAALQTKCAWAQETGIDAWLVTQFVFDPAPVFGWEARLRAQDLALPVDVGVAGPARVDTLLRYALQCGIGASTRMLTRRPTTARLLGAWRPDEVVDPLLDHRRRVAARLIRGLHLFPFGGLERTLAWLKSFSYQPDERAGADAESSQPGTIDPARSETNHDVAR